VPYQHNAQLYHTSPIDKWLKMHYTIAQNAVNVLLQLCLCIFFKRSAVRNTRGNSMKLDKQHFISNRDGHFCNRIINAWTSLSDYVVTSPTVPCFKHKLANFNFTL